jgi:hypothetical protein
MTVMFECDLNCNWKQEFVIASASRLDDESKYPETLTY